MFKNQHADTEATKEDKHEKRRTLDAHTSRHAPTHGNTSSSDYIPISLLGQSAYGEVVLANNRDGKKVVMKKINRLKMNKNLIANEVAAATSLSHPGIVKVYDIFREGIYTYIILEYLKGQDFFKFLSHKSFAPIREKEARKLFRQLVAAVQYCHTQHIAHRDIKLENIMYDRKKNRVKLIDFGLCERIESGQLCDLWCGSQDYVCPEIIKKEAYNGYAADVWSLGTILYIMLYGELPFGFDIRVKAVTDGKEHPNIVFADDRNPNVVTDSAKELISQMLEVDPAKRINMTAVAQHRWTRKKSLLEFMH